VDHATDLGHVPVHVGVRCGVRAGGVVALDQGAAQVGDDHGVGGELVVGDTGRFDEQQVPAGHPGRDIAGGPDDQLVRGQLGVQLGHLTAQALDSAPDIGGDAHATTSRCR